MAINKKIAVGDDVIVAGNPWGLEGTFSKGIVSGLRHNPERLQIDAAISPGSSGGPVLNMRGEVIGIATSSLAMLTIGGAVAQDKGQDKAKTAVPTTQTVKADPSGIIFFGKQQVDAMFAKGGELYNGLPTGKSYQIFTSRRVNPGPAESERAGQV